MKTKSIALVFGTVCLTALFVFLLFRSGTRKFDERDITTPEKSMREHYDFPKPTAVRPQDPNLPPSGVSSLQTILGFEEAVFVFNSVNGLCGSDQNVSFERNVDSIVLTFETGLTIKIDTNTGKIFTPDDLPSISDEELSSLTWKQMESSGEIEQWKEVYRQTGEPNPIEIRLDEIRRVADKAFVAWRIIETSSEDDSFIRIVFWVDVRTKKIVQRLREIHEDR